MQLFKDVQLQQKKYISECKFKTKRFIEYLNLDKIEAILVSGSVARGDYKPGKYGGNIDLTVLKSRDIDLKAEELFGRDEEPEIPYHCVTHMGQGFQIAFYDIFTVDEFLNFNEYRKNSILESELLFEVEEVYTQLLNKLDREIEEDIHKKMCNSLGYINYLLSGYKKNRWIIREAYPQLHSNLNKAIEIAVKCLYYTNGRYAPSEDRILYYSYSLPGIGEGYRKIMTELYKQDINSYEDYTRRENIFNKLIIPMLDITRDQI